jgi:hypothetical protein
MTLAEVSLDDKYAKDRGRIYLTGIQALVRLPMLQHERDRAAARVGRRGGSRCSTAAGPAPTSRGGGASWRIHLTLRLND